MRVAFIGIRRYFYMLDWLKFFSGSFFVNKFAMQGADRKIGNAVVSFLLGWILLFVGLIIGYSSSFNTHLNNCPSALQTIANVFDDGICVKTENYRALSGKNGSFDNAEVINTFTNENDAKKYSSDGFNFILDTRPIE